MSLSSHSSSREPSGLEHLTVAPIHHVPALDRQITPAPEPPADAPAAEQDAPAATQTAAPAAEPAAPAAESAEQTATPETEGPAAAEKAPAAPAKAKWPGVLLDTLLVCMVLAVLGGGGYYLNSEWQKYRVPSALDIAYEQCKELCARRDAMLEDFHRADEQQHMRDRAAYLSNRLRERYDQIARVEASIAEQKKMVLALQHEIRRADKEARAVARGLLPGLQIGDVTSTRGKVYQNAVIARVEGRRISLRTPYGAATLPISELVKDNLPDLVLYALGVIDLVDMSDFTATGAAPASPQPKNTKLRTTVKPVNARDYEPRSAGPVLDTNKRHTPVQTQPDSGYSAGDVWQAPEGELPL